MRFLSCRFLARELVPGPLHWELGVLAPGPPRKSLIICFLFNYQVSCMVASQHHWLHGCGVWTCRRHTGPQGQEGPALGLILCSCSLQILFFFFSLSLFLNWSIIASQCCASFCCTTKLISHMYTYVPSLLSLPPTHALMWWASRSSQSPSWAPASKQGSVYVNATLSICAPLFFAHCVHTSILYVCVSIPALQIGSCVPLFSLEIPNFWTTSISISVGPATYRTCPVC